MVFLTSVRSAESVVIDDVKPEFHGLRSVRRFMLRGEKRRNEEQRDKCLTMLPLSKNGQR